jgi:site-specific recombinase XerD
LQKGVGTNSTAEVSWMTVSESAKAFLRSCEIDKNLSSLTVRAYKTDLSQLELFATQHGVNEVTAIDVALVQCFIAHLKEHQLCIDSSIRRKIAVIRAFLKFLEANGSIPQNPMAKMRLSFRCQRKLPRVLSRDQVEAILKAAKRPEHSGDLHARLASLRNYALLELLFFSGARISELLRLDIDDLDLDEGFTKIKGKGRRERVIYIGCEPVVAALRRYLKLRLTVEKRDRALFVNSRLSRLSVYSAEAVVRKCAEAANISARITPHMFRHTMATMLLENGADLRSIQEILGHASISTTEIYTHVSGNRKRQVMREFHPRQQFDFRRKRSA